jgi:MFS family permease
MIWRPSGLWTHPDFRRLWAGQTISRFGSHIGEQALRFTAIYVLQAAGGQLALLATCAIAPRFAFGLLAGVWVDRLRRRPLLIAADIGRAALLFAIPVLYLWGRLGVNWLYLVAALTGTLTILFDTAYQAFVPTVVQREQLGEANSKLGVSDSLAEIAGPPIGGLLVQLISAPLAVAFDALSFLASAVFVGRITTPEQRPSASAGGNVLVEVAQGLRAVAVEPLLRAMLAAGVTAGLAGGIIGALYDLYLARELGFSPAVIGLTIGVGGMSALLGAFVAQPLVARFGLGPTMVLAATISGAAAALLPLACGQLALPLILLSQASDASYAVYFILATTLRQTITPDRLLGRVAAGFDLLPLGALLLGTLLAAALSEMIGLRAAIAIGAAGVFVANAWLWFSPLPRLRSVTASDS